MATTTDHKDTKPEQRRWKTFGQNPPQATPDSPPPELLGWAIGSSQLWLRQGKRTVVLTLGFRQDAFDHDRLGALFAREAPFKVELSTDKGWIEPAAPKIVLGDYQQLGKLSRSIAKPLQAIQLTLHLGEDVDPIVPPATTDTGLASPWPMLRLMLRRIWDEDRGQYITHYQPFKDLVLVAAHVQAEVAGLVPTHVQNDDLRLDARKPFEPFGISPVSGSHLHVGDPELVVKRLDSLEFALEWMGAPEDLPAYYKSYGVSGAFTARISLIDNRLQLPLTEEAKPLFDSADATSPHTIELGDIPGAIHEHSPDYRYEPALEPATGDDLLTWSRYLQWELGSPDFQHQAYPAVATQKSIEMAAAIAQDTKIKAEDYQVNPPYTPKLKGLRLGYTSSAEVVLEASSQDTRTSTRAGRLFHIHPFGASPIQPKARDAAGDEGTRFLPRYDYEGELYIGIHSARPPQNLSILFQMAEGSADPDLQPVPVEWSYLSDNRWVSLHDGHILSDTTRGLINSGILELALAPARRSTLLPGDLYWIRAAIPYQPNSVCDAIAVHTQAVSAIFIDHDNAPDHYTRPLPEHSITGLVDPVPELAAVEQPYTSRGGKPAESAGWFHTRVSERLRHKQRALSIWDYERLVLEAFPNIYKAKCIPANLAERPDQPGQVSIIVIPDIRNQSLSNPFEPKAPANLLADIQSYLADRCPAHAAVEVRNAHYVPVKVRVGVRFQPGRDEGYYKKLLNEELSRFLCPWAYDEGADIVIGGKIYANSIVSFIDERAYVDYVATIKLFSSEDGRTFELARPTGSPGYFVTTDKPDGVLVAARQHEIDIIPEIGYTEKTFTGIDYMKVELDFIVG